METKIVVYYGGVNYWNEPYFEEEVDKALEKIGESGYDIATVHTSAGNEIF